MPTSSHATLSSASPAAGWDAALLRNPHAVADKRQRVQSMFSAIAPSYDLNNHLHSLWLDQAWRRRAVKFAQLRPGDVAVDIACGTGDVTDALLRGLSAVETSDQQQAAARQPRVIGIDFTFAMLPIARQKLAAGSTSGEYRRVAWINGDALSLPLPDRCCDVATIAFGIRNVSDPAAAIREFRRILRPGGRLIILEFSLPTNPILRGLYNFYFRRVLPRTATWISGDRTGAYRYLPESVNTFISRAQMRDMMAAAGFVSVRVRPMTFGVAVAYRGDVQP